MPLPHLQLNQAQRQDLERLTASGSLPARVFKRARALLLLDRGHTIQDVSRILSVSAQSVSTWRDRFKQEALAMLFDKPRSGRPVEIDGTARAKITALACTEPPEGHARWDLRLLADKAVELGYCDHLSHTHAATILKKTNSSRT
ncbi:MAG: helix-turn-helix domain-containing protein [Bacteroidota bacterium]